ncbi:MAG: helix-turn-helix transcriptional regulator [Chloroflexota bacterium]|nr:MAG: helix-turn-helix transcriptional regulator [Chloroflexota bacterium]
MDNPPIAIAIRSKKLGVLIQGARLAYEKSTEECAEALGISTEQFGSYERGAASPSLPELEALAFYLRIPMDYFWGREIVDLTRDEPQIFEKDRLMRLRNRVIGATLRQARLEAGLTTLELSSSAGINEEQLNSYELGEQSIPLPELEALANSVNRTIKDFQDSRGPIGKWIKQQQAMKNFDDLSPELQDFISRPINRPYLEIAQRLSEMSVDKLRTVAEGLLEITL